MRKYSVGAIITFTFLAYSMAIRHHNLEPVIKTVFVTNNSSNTSATTTSPATTQSTSTNSSTSYKDGTYTGSVEDAFYGNVEVSAIISGGQIKDVKFLQYPNDNPNSQNINQQATPLLKQEAIAAQSSNVNIISGATLTSQAFIQSLSNALNQAKS